MGSYPSKFFAFEISAKVLDTSPGCSGNAPGCSDTISTGSMGTRSPAGDCSGVTSRRHLNSWLALTSCRRATIETDEPGSSVSATIRRFNASGQSRRLRRRLVSTNPEVDTSVDAASMPHHRAKQQSSAGVLHRALTLQRVLGILVVS